MHPAFPRDRYSPESFEQALEAAPRYEKGDRIISTLEVNGQEVDLEFPIASGDGSSHPNCCISAVIQQIHKLDNLVQDSCEREWKSSRFGPENFELYLAYLVLKEDQLVLGYYGSKVNTEWDAKFKWSGCEWSPENL